MNNTTHLIEYFDLQNGNRIYVYDYCSSDENFTKKLNAYYMRYDVAFVRANHSTEKRGDTARTRDGKWVNIKHTKNYMKAGRYSYDSQTNRKAKRQYFFSSVELAEAMFKKYKPIGATLQGRLMTVPFAIGYGTHFINQDFSKIRWAY